jgi:hypothetical protein
VHRRVEVLGFACCRANVGDAGAHGLTAATRGVHVDLVRPGLGADERAAILAIALTRPLQRHSHRRAVGTRDGGDRGGVVQLDETLVHDGGLNGDDVPGLDAIGRGAHVHDIGNAIHKPAQELTPVMLVRLILERDGGVHLPEPRVLRGQGDALASTVTLP